MAYIYKPTISQQATKTKKGHVYRLVFFGTFGTVGVLFCVPFILLIKIDPIRWIVSVYGIGDLLTYSTFSPYTM